MDDFTVDRIQELFAGLERTIQSMQEDIETIRKRLDETIASLGKTGEAAPSPE